MNSLLQLLVAGLVVAVGAVLALRADRKAHCDDRQGTLDLRTQENDKFKNNRVAMSRTPHI
jgi:hypothetical protein